MIKSQTQEPERPIQNCDYVAYTSKIVVYTTLMSSMNELYEIAY